MNLHKNMHIHTHIHTNTHIQAHTRVDTHTHRHTVPTHKHKYVHIHTQYTPILGCSGYFKSHQFSGHQAAITKQAGATDLGGL